MANFEWPEDVAVEDASVAAHRVLHLLQELRPERVVFVSGFPRGDAPGTVRRYPVEQSEMPDDAEVAERMGEAAGGVIDFDHTLIVARYFKALPEDSVVIEIEAEDTAFGTGFSDSVESNVERVIELVREEVAR